MNPTFLVFMKWSFVTIMILALAPQVFFTIFYWSLIPTWVGNSYGRLAQLGAWCHIILLSLYLSLILFGTSFNPYVAQIMLLIAFLPLVFFGFFQLVLLKRAVNSSDVVQEEDVKR